jgi:hypothetical protein
MLNVESQRQLHHPLHAHREHGPQLQIVVPERSGSFRFLKKTTKQRVFMPENRDVEKI